MRKSLVTVICLVTACLLITSCQLSGVSETEAVQYIAKDQILEDTRILSADDMKGRAPGTSGELKAAQYISDRFKESGLSPINGSYFQIFDMLGSRKVGAKSSLTIKRQNEELPYQSDETLTYWSTSLKEMVDIRDAPLVFAGYGVQAPEVGWDDYKGIDVKGKVLLFLNNDPPVSEEGVELFKGEARTYYGRWTYKFEQAMKLGAAGAIMIHTTPSASYPFSVVQRSGAEEHFSIELPGSGYQVDFLAWIDETTSNRIAESMGTDLNGLFEMGARRDFRPIDTGYRITSHIENTIRRTETRNVMGMLPGTDPILRNQVIVFSAHYDHLGENKDLQGDDKIYNGAWDNALGVSSIIGLAKAFSSLKNGPRRSILFLACAAEESGSLGSKWFVAKSPFDRNRLVANINIDMPQVLGLTSDIAAIGVDMSTLGDTLREAARTYPGTTAEEETINVMITGDPNPNAGSFYRSDQVNFAKAGIPALSLNPGTEYLTKPGVDPIEYEDSHYHQVIDEVDELWDLTGLERDMRVVFQMTLRLANDDEMPRWVEGSEFEGKWEELHKISK